MATPYSRVTVAADSRWIDVSLPSDEPVGRLVPEVLRLAGPVQPGDRPHAQPARTPRLVTPAGTALPGQLTLAQAGITDGTLLRLVPEEGLPRSPHVHDVTAMVADDLNVRNWRWGPRAKEGVATGATLVLTVTIGLLVLNNLGPVSGAVALGSMAIVLLAAGAVAATCVGKPLGSAVGGAAGVVGVLAAWATAGAFGWPGSAAWALAIAATALAMVAVGPISHLGRAGWVGGVCMLGLVLGWTVGAVAQLPTYRLAAVMAVVSVILLGFLPRLALVTSGLAGLDDRRSTGSAVTRQEFETATSAAHRGLLIAMVATSACAAAAGVLLSSVVDPWTVPLAVLIVVVLAVRARKFPLAAEVAVSLAAALVILLTLTHRWAAEMPGFPYGPLVVLVLVAGLPLLCLAFDVPEHVRARLRVVGDWVETVAVLAFFPLLFGVFGVFERLLTVF